MPDATSRQPALNLRYSIVAFIALGTPPLLAIHQLHWLGWLCMGLVTLVCVWYIRSRFAQHMLLLVAMLTLLGLIPINTTITYAHMFGMGTVLALTILVPYAISHYAIKDKAINFPFGMGRSWYKKEIGYVLFAGVGAYLILPYYLGSTGSYLNWGVVLDPSHIARLFIGTNALGIWDELFFIGICLTLLRKYLPFVWANLAQAIMWTAFLYELGFRGWGPFAIFAFALSQGIVFKNTKSLLYIITVHLTLDFVLFLVLIHLHHPEHLNIFITSPF